MNPMIKWVKDYIEKENPVLRRTMADYEGWFKTLSKELYGLRNHDIKKSK